MPKMIAPPIPASDRLKASTPKLGASMAITVAMLSNTASTWITSRRG
jgi:hypothetical protein